MGLNETNKMILNPSKNVGCRRGRMESNCYSSSEGSAEFRANEVPPIVPCYNGKSLKIHEDLVLNGLCAISIKHHNGSCKEERRGSVHSDQLKLIKRKSEEDKENQSKSNDVIEFFHSSFPKTNVGLPDCMRDKMKRRNSFWNVHRPELSKLTWPENFVSSAVLQDFFHNHLRVHGTFCEPLHEYSNRSSLLDEEIRDFSKLREIVPPRVLPPDEKFVNIMEKSRSVQLNDEDLDPEIQVHKSRAEFCVTIGEYVRRPPLKRTTSQVVPKCVVQPANRFESLPVQHEGLLSKETMMSEERVSAIIGSTDFFVNEGTGKNSRKVSTALMLKCSSFADTKRMVSTSSPSLNDLYPKMNRQRPEDSSGDPIRCRFLHNGGETSNLETEKK